MFLYKYRSVPRGKEPANTFFTGKADGFFCCRNKLLWLHTSTNKDSFYSVHKPVKCEGGGSQLHNRLSGPRYVIGAFGFVVRLHVPNMN